MASETWLLLIHQVPATPLYARARIRTLLERAGAVALKKSVYVLPKRPGSLERLQSIAAEIERRGGEAHVCEASFPDARGDQALIAAFRDRSEREFREVLDAAAAPGSPEALRKLERQLDAARTHAYFGARGAREAEAALRRLRDSAGGPRKRGARATPWTGRTWVTRRGVHVDRIACAWLIRRRLDPGARIRFLDPGALPGPDELGFDIPGGEFTHEDGRCSLETLIAKTGIADPALTRIAEIVHDIDIKDGAYGHPETAGVERLLAGIAATHRSDEARIERGGALLDDLLGSFLKAPPVAPRGAVALASRVRRGTGRGRT